MKTVIEMALEAGFDEIAFHKEGDSDFVCFTDEIEKFAEMIRADAIAEERDAVEELLKEYDMVNSTFAKDFRARSNT